MVVGIADGAHRPRDPDPCAQATVIVGGALTAVVAVEHDTPRCAAPLSASCYPTRWFLRCGLPPVAGDDRSGQVRAYQTGSATMWIRSWDTARPTVACRASATTSSTTCSASACCVVGDGGVETVERRRGATTADHRGLQADDLAVTVVALDRSGPDARLGRRPTVGR